MNIKPWIAKPGAHVRLRKFDPADTGPFKDSAQVEEKLASDIRRLSRLQDKLYAQHTYAVLVILQAMDAAGKDAAVKHVMSGVNPQGCRVVSFKQPSALELDHDFLWRCTRELPPRGHIGIFNRSYYEEVLVTRVHPELLEAQHLPPHPRGGKFWDERFKSINHFERHWTNNGVVILKCFLHVSREEQKRRFLSRIDEPAKNWKFSEADLRERVHWDAYQDAYQDMIRNTGTACAPWHILPADHKWFTHVLLAEILIQALEALPLGYPSLSPAQRRGLLAARRALLQD